MEDLTTYTFDISSPEGVRGHPYELVEEGVLVPDTRLQAIADA